jgi:short-subunit dehydrogenase
MRHEWPRVVVITGASSGIGHATALAFARRGDRVVLFSRSDDALARVAEEIVRAGGAALPVAGDVSRFEDLERVAQSAVAAFGGIDVWINNAAVGEWALVEDMTSASMRRVLEVNVLGVMYGTRIAIPHLRARGGGVIINVSSAVGEHAVPLLSTYSASKAAIKSFTDALRMELRATNTPIAAVSILPASINTPFYRWGASKLGVRPHPISVIYPPEAVARAIVSAADRPQRDVYVGGLAKLLALGNRISPRVLDWYMLRGGNFFRQQYSATADAGESNLFQTAHETDVAGDYTAESRRTSVYTRAVELRPAWRRVALGAILLGVVSALSKRSRAGTEGRPRSTPALPAGAPRPSSGRRR